MIGRSERAAPRLNLLDTSALILIPRLTAFLALVAASRSAGRLLVGLGVVLIVFASPRIARNGWMWLSLGTVMGIWNLADWYRVDNHVVLAGYWYLALGAALLGDRPEERLRDTARLVIGLAFAVAAVRKWTSPEFVAGDFFEFTLLTDPRFEPAATLVGGLSSEAAAMNRDVVASLPATGTLMTAGGIRPLATVMTWAALFVESAVAILNLLRGEPWRLAGQVALVVFVVATYAIVPVVAFGGALIVMGAASARTGRSRLLWAASFFVIAFWGMIWQATVLSG